LAGRALVLTSLLSLLGSGLGVCGIGQGVVTGVEIPLVLSCVLFSAGTLLRLIAGRRGGLQTLPRFRRFILRCTYVRVRLSQLLGAASTSTCSSS
jgi:hypothetical protein